MRKVLAVTLLAGVVLLAVGPLAIVGSLAQQRQQDKALQTEATQVAAAFTSYFERARSLDLLLAQNPALHQRPGTVTPEANDAANRALEYLERLYPGAIGEACLIDDEGRELARVTRGVPAPIGELSTNEAQNPFFAPTFALKLGQVYQAAPYVSQDTHTWVISNSTRIVVADGRSLLVHFEVSLGSFADQLATGTGEHSVVVDESTGRTILADDTDLPTSDTPVAGEFPVFAHSSVLGSSGAHARTIDADGLRLAVSGIPSKSGNANHWTVVQWSNHGAGVLPVWLGGVLTAAGAFMLFFFVVLLRRQHNALRLAARRDHLTNMANRKGLEEALEEAVAASRRTGEKVGVLMLDLDGFKQVNDTFGHDRGDAVLQEIGRRLHANTLEYDTAGRFGGDEYAVILRRLHEGPDVATVATRLREALVRPVEVDGIARFVGVSIGASVFPDHGASAAELLRAADAAMYRAKRGREGIRVYETGTPEGATGSWLAAELLVAIEQDQITMVYQPEQDIESGRVVSVEALARWIRPGHSGNVAPSEFVPLAEETGLIRPLTHLTMRKALDEVKVWRDAGIHVPVSVNLSARLVTDRSLPGDVQAMLAERGLSGDALILEITETALVADVDIACAVLGELRASGVRIELDDFGSGYASTRALREMPLDGIKVDRDLVNDFSPSGQSLLAATIDVGKVLNLYVVAEGIENEEGLGRMRSLGADIVQGYHLGRPMSQAAIRLALTSDQVEALVQPQS
ncbi:MAG: hypothetical protein QOD98_2412 [Nocardioidaceae bacterium]|nr:hypothetical protein [Nocardioidaceae bacterium]